MRIRNETRKGERGRERRKEADVYRERGSLIMSFDTTKL